MSYNVTAAQFAGKLKSIQASAKNMRDLVQDALIAATFICIKDNMNATPFQRILDAVGTAAHRQGIASWAETFAPVRLVNDGFKGNKSAFQQIDTEAILANFDAYIAETGMAEVKWYDIAKGKNKVESMFNLDTSLDAFLKKLDKNGLSGLAEHLRKAEQEYMAKAIRAEMTAGATE